MTATGIYETEEKNRSTVVLYKTGAFWRAYQRSAYFVNKTFKEYAVVHQRLKPAKSAKVDLVYVRVPDRVFDSFLTSAEERGYVVRERGDEQIVLEGFKGIYGYDAWLNRVSRSRKLGTELDSLKDVLLEMENVSVVVQGEKVRFNRKSNVMLYRKYLTELSMQVVADSLKWEERYSPVLLNKRLSVLLREAKNCYREETKKKIIHNNLYIVADKRRVAFETLSESVREQIGDFVALQYETLCKLSSVLTYKMILPSNFPFEWGGSQAEGIELLWALYHTKRIVPREPDGSLRLLMDLFFRLLHQTPPQHVHQQVFKLLSRHNAQRFLHKLSEESERVRYEREE